MFNTIGGFTAAGKWAAISLLVELTVPIHNGTEVFFLWICEKPDNVSSIILLIMGFDSDLRFMRDSEYVDKLSTHIWWKFWWLGPRKSADMHGAKAHWLDLKLSALCTGAHDFNAPM